MYVTILSNLKTDRRKEEWAVSKEESPILDSIKEARSFFGAALFPVNDIFTGHEDEKPISIVAFREQLIETHRLEMAKVLGWNPQCYDLITFAIGPDIRVMQRSLAIEVVLAIICVNAQRLGIDSLKLISHFIDKFGRKVLGKRKLNFCEFAKRFAIAKRRLAQLEEDFQMTHGTPDNMILSLDDFLNYMQAGLK